MIDLDGLDLLWEGIMRLADRWFGLKGLLAGCVVPPLLVLLGYWLWFRPG